MGVFLLMPGKHAPKEKEQRGDEPDEARRFRQLQLQDEFGRIPVDGMEKAKEQMAAMKSMQAQQARALGKGNDQYIAGIDPGAWIWLGPGNIGGRIRSIIIHPTNPSSMWVGSVGGGIWHSTDAGVSWQPAAGFGADLVVSTLALDPTNPNIIYAGTGESFSADQNVTEGQNIASNGQRGAGVFKSPDGGVT